MTNDEICSQLRYRQKRLGEILTAQKSFEAKELVSAELEYVTRLVDFRIKYGSLESITIPDGTDQVYGANPPNEKS
jgi:hypothetical protein